MPRLSIVIPAQGTVEALERSLVSVLENRPTDCEIIVVLNTRYDDPYQLTDEVQFVTAPQGANWSECVAAGVRHARAPIVHLLAAGAEVTENWSQPALDHFRDPQVWSVAASTYDRCAPEHLLNQGIDATPAIERFARRTPILATNKVAGPAWWGGFYRRQQLDANAGFDRDMPAEVAASDLAWRQQLAGRRCAVEPRSALIVPTDWQHSPAGLAAGYQSERLYWRQRADRSRRSSLVGHVLLLATLAVSGLVRPKLWLHLLGKVAAAASRGRFAREGAATVAQATAAQQRPPLEMSKPHILPQRSSTRASAFGQ